MFDLCVQFLVQEIELIPAFFGVSLIFSLTRDLLFKE